MTLPTNWTRLPDTDAFVLFGADGVPLLLLSRGGDDREIGLELEARHGWRVQTKTITNHDSPSGWLRMVEYAGRIAIPMEYAALKKIPSEWREIREGVDIQKLTGLCAYSAMHQLREPWDGHPRGTHVVWSSHPGALGVVYVVGVGRVLGAILPSVDDLDALVGVERA